MIRAILKLWRQARCKHSRIFIFHPDALYWKRDGVPRGTITHGFQFEACPDCGRVWFVDYGG